MIGDYPSPTYNLHPSAQVTVTFADTEPRFQKRLFNSRYV